MKYQISASIGKDKYKTEITNDRNSIVADEPEDLGGEDLGLAPFELVLSSLAACKAITMRMYADRKEWPLEEVKLEMDLEVQKTSGQQTTYINANIELIGDLDDEQKERIIKIADRCPTHKLLQNPIVINSTLIQK